MLELPQHRGTEKKATEKEAFFEELFDLDKPDYSSGDVNEFLKELRASRPSGQFPGSSHNKRRPSYISRQIRHFGRTVSAPIDGTSLLGATSTETLPKVKDSHISKAALSVSIDSTDGQAGQSLAPDVKMSVASNRKRKRGKSLDVLPDAQQIFKGLRFYFIPNDDVAPARKLRIRKALERGATWIKDWDDGADGITHVIVDKHLTNSDILKFLKIPSIPSGIVVVNEIYPAECIQFQMLVNPDQRLYQIKGRQEKPAPGRKRSIENPSTISLPLKPNKILNSQPSQTPKRIEPNVIGSLDQPPDEAEVGHTSPQAPYQPPLDSRDRSPDALDKAIEETLAVKDLVSCSVDETLISTNILSLSTMKMKKVLVRAW